MHLYREAESQCAKSSNQFSSRSKAIIVQQIKCCEVRQRYSNWEKTKVQIETEKIKKYEQEHWLISNKMCVRICDVFVWRWIALRVYRAKWICVPMMCKCASQVYWTGCQKSDKKNRNNIEPDLLRMLICKVRSSDAVNSVSCDQIFFVLLPHFLWHYAAVFFLIALFRFVFVNRTELSNCHSAVVAV